MIAPLLVVGGLLMLGGKPKKRSKTRLAKTGMNRNIFVPLNARGYISALLRDPPLVVITAGPALTEDVEDKVVETVHAYADNDPTLAFALTLNLEVVEAGGRLALKLMKEPEPEPLLDPEVALSLGAIRMVPSEEFGAGPVRDHDMLNITADVPATDVQYLIVRAIEWAHGDWAKILPEDW